MKLEFDLDNIETNPLLIINFLSNCYYETIFRRYIGIKDFLESLTLLFQFSFAILKVFINYLRRNSKCFEIVHKIFFLINKSMKTKQILLFHLMIILYLTQIQKKLKKIRNILKNYLLIILKQAKWNKLENGTLGTMLEMAIADSMGYRFEFQPLRAQSPNIFFLKSHI